MQTYQREFIELAIAADALRFGSFTLKSGRQSPYFFNAGMFASGNKLAKIGEAYANAITASNIEYDMLFGPAYKGIPLAVSTVIALASQHKKDVPYAFNRKEAKTHGEGGNIVGSALAGRVLIVDDVITAGTAIRESMQIIKDAGAKPAGIVISVNRQERGQTQLSAIQEIEQTFQVPVYSIINLTDLIEYVQNSQDFSSYLAAMKAYREEYGV